MKKLFVIVILFIFTLIAIYDVQAVDGSCWKKDNVETNLAGEEETVSYDLKCWDINNIQFLDLNSISDYEAQILTYCSDNELGSKVSLTSLSLVSGHPYPQQATHSFTCNTEATCGTATGKELNFNDGFAHKDDSWEWCGVSSQMEGLYWTIVNDSLQWRWFCKDKRDPNLRIVCASKQILPESHTLKVERGQTIPLSNPAFSCELGVFHTGATSPISYEVKIIDSSGSVIVDENSIHATHDGYFQIPDTATLGTAQIQSTVSCLCENTNCRAGYDYQLPLSKQFGSNIAKKNAKIVAEDKVVDMIYLKKQIEIVDSQSKEQPSKLKGKQKDNSVIEFSVSQDPSLSTPLKIQTAQGPASLQVVPIGSPGATDFRIKLDSQSYCGYPSQPNDIWALKMYTPATPMSSEIPPVRVDYCTGCPVTALAVSLNNLGTSFEFEKTQDNCVKKITSDTTADMDVSASRIEDEVAEVCKDAGYISYNFKSISRGRIAGYQFTGGGCYECLNEPKFTCPVGQDSGTYSVTKIVPNFGNDVGSAEIGYKYYIYGALKTNGTVGYGELVPQGVQKVHEIITDRCSNFKLDQEVYHGNRPENPNDVPKSVTGKYCCTPKTPCDMKSCDTKTEKQCNEQPSKCSWSTLDNECQENPEYYFEGTWSATMNSRFPRTDEYSASYSISGQIQASGTAQELGIAEGAVEQKVQQYCTRRNMLSEVIETSRTAQTEVSGKYCCVEKP